MAIRTQGVPDSWLLAFPQLVRSNPVQYSGDTGTHIQQLTHFGDAGILVSLGLSGMADVLLSKEKAL
jgi:hypothetical protein